MTALFAPASVTVEPRDDGSLILRSPMPLRSHPARVGDWLVQWADVAPGRPFLFERGPDGQWTGVNYGDALARVRRIAAGLLQRRLSPERPIAILSDNSVDHALLMLGAMHAGIPVAPLSPAYSLMSKDFGKLRAIVQLLEPGLIFVADPARFAPALGALSGLHTAEIVVASHCTAPGATRLSSIECDDDTHVDAAFAALRPDTIAKFLFTSGSTGDPKAVINTHRMLTSNQQAKAQLWPFLVSDPPVIVDWLPWSHTFGANHNFNMVLRNGGTLYIDAGKPVPGLFEQTLANLREIAPTLYFNVPRGYDMLVSALSADSTLAANFFSRLRLLFYAGAALPQHLWDKLLELSRQARGEPLPLVTSWGSTETAPLATDCNFQAPRSGVIGNPVPGTELKLVPLDATSGQYEIRVRGANVTPGYWKQPELSAAAFDEDGFYRIGDAVRFFATQHPEQGVVFDGRLAEDFKLSTGTRVNAGTLRIRGIAALAPIAQDIVVTGHDTEWCGFLVFPNLAACRNLAKLPAEATLQEVVAHPDVRMHLRLGLHALREASSASSMHARRALLLVDPPSIDAGEITDKGYLNQRAVRERRTRDVERLHALDPGDDIIAL